MLARITPAPVSPTRPMSTPLTVAAVATGMNSGVGTLPCGVVSTPARAAPSVASSGKKILVASATIPRQRPAERVRVRTSLVALADHRKGSG